MRIAILEDEDVQRAHLLLTLQSQLDLGEEPISCHPFEQGEDLRRALRRESFDMLVLDWNVPDLNGLDLLRWLRQFQGSHIPVLMLSSRGSEHDVVHALTCGADDYIIKPFRPSELCARIKRLAPQALKNQQNKTNLVTTEVFGDWLFDRSVLSVQPPGALQNETGLALDASETIHLTEREFRLASALFRNLGQPVSRHHLLECAGYNGEELPTRTLDSHMYRLRIKLGLSGLRGVRLQTVYGIGYRLELM